MWHIDKPKELLRITVPNMTCNSLDFMVDGHSIISGGYQREISASKIALELITAKKISHNYISKLFLKLRTCTKMILFHTLHQIILLDN